MRVCLYAAVAGAAAAFLARPPGWGQTCTPCVQCRTLPNQGLNCRRFPYFGLQASHMSVEEPSLFDRHHETQQLQILLAQPPATIRAILGPVSCGKTRLLQTFVTQLYGTSICYINCRRIDAISPDGFAEALAIQGLPRILQQLPASAQAKAREGMSLHSWFNMLPELKLKLGLGGPMNVEVQLASRSTAKGKVPQQELAPVSPGLELSSIGHVLRTYEYLLEQWPAARQANSSVGWPVIVIDEANRLMQWSEEYPKQLRTLLDFLVSVSKEGNQCHVLLVTSDYAFQPWLSNAIGTPNFETEVIGDFVEQDARSFLEWKLGNTTGSVVQSDKVYGKMPITMPVTLTDGDWDTIYKVCGGNAGALCKAAVRYTMPYHRGNWTSVLQAVVRATEPFVEAAADDQDGWTGAQFADAALCLLDTPHKAVTRKKMELLLGRHVITTENTRKQAAAGKLVLAALIKANRLSLRPFSELARDVPREAYGEPPTSIVTAPSTVELWCMQMLRTHLAALLMDWKEQRGQDAGL